MLKLCHLWSQLFPSAKSTLVERVIKAEVVHLISPRFQPLDWCRSIKSLHLNFGSEQSHSEYPIQVSWSVPILNSGTIIFFMQLFLFVYQLHQTYRIDERYIQFLNSLVVFWKFQLVAISSRSLNLSFSIIVRFRSIRCSLWQKFPRQYHLLFFQFTSWFLWLNNFFWSHFAHRISCLAIWSILEVQVQKSLKQAIEIRRDL